MAVSSPSTAWNDRQGLGATNLRGSKILIRMARRNDRQQEVRGAGALGEDAVAGDARLLPRAFRLARIGVDVEMREIAARYVEPQAVPTPEQIGDREQLDGDRIDLARYHRRRPLPAVTIAHP